jgi:hypothetical protein
MKTLSHLHRKYLCNIIGQEMHGSFRERGRDRKTWKECVAYDIRQLRLTQEDAQDRDVWRKGILGTMQAQKYRRPFLN